MVNNVIETMETHGFEFFPHMLIGSKKLPLELELETGIRKDKNNPKSARAYITIKPTYKFEDVFNKFTHEMGQKIPYLEVDFTTDPGDTPSLKKKALGRDWYAPIQDLQETVLPALSAMITNFESCFNITMTGLEYFVHPDCFPERKGPRKLVPFNDPIEEAFKYETGKEHIFIDHVVKQ